MKKSTRSKILFNYYIKWLYVHPAVRMRIRRINQFEYFKIWVNSGMMIMTSILDRPILYLDRIVTWDWKKIF